MTNTRGPGAAPRTKCKLDGCDNAPHIYPGGGKSPYCKEHMRFRRAKIRDGLPSMTGPMKVTLRYLLECKKRDILWVQLEYPHVDRRTLTGLLKRGWIAQSKTDTDIRYRITANGEDALKVYTPRRNRGDKICPRCGERPRHVGESGRRQAYCLECENERDKHRRDAGKANGDVSRPCSRCHKHPRHQYAGGSWSTYCTHCERVRARRKIRRERKALLESIRRGAPIPPCKHCKEKPRRVFANSVSNYCEDCGPRMVRRSKLKKKLNAALRPQRAA